MSRERASFIVGYASTFHDPALCFAVDDVIYAEAIERHTQCKRSIGSLGLWYSARAVREALRSLGRSPGARTDATLISSWDLDRLLSASASALRVDPAALLDATVMRQGPQFATTAMQLVTQRMMPVIEAQVSRILGSASAPLSFAPSPLADVTTKSLGHHLGHAANAVFTSPFDSCLVVILDGHGEETGLTVYHYDGDDFRCLTPTRTPRGELTLGLMVEVVTELCGFSPADGEAWKMMGLAAHGAPRGDIYDFFRRRVRVDGLEIHVDMSLAADSAWTELAGIVGGFRVPDDDDLLRAADLAHNFQRFYEDTLFELLNQVAATGLSRNLALAGGCALNSSANGKILGRTPFTSLHVPSAPADDGNALGCVLYEKHQVRKQPRSRTVMSPYLGSTLDMVALERALGLGDVPHRVAANESALCLEVAELLAAGSIVGWAQGRAEFGPRALGNRSILADPRARDMKRRINDLIKLREWYRPLAPSILHEHGPRFFDDYQDSPFMERALVFRADVRDLVPAVVHQDGTGRLHSVTKERCPLFHELLCRFHDRTGIPMLLNTSLNVMGKPIIHSVEDALTIFHTTGLDALVIGTHIFTKRRAEESRR